MKQKAFSDALPPQYQLHWYVLEKVLGQGGFGITYCARDTNLDQMVAIKEYLPIDIASRRPDTTIWPRSDEHDDRYRGGLERFIREARTLARFDHPNIVRVYSVFEFNNTAYMVMRFEEGITLAALLERRQVLLEGDVMRAMLPVLDGLELVHKAGFIHRDIKPDNILIRPDGSTLLLDFGSARVAVGQQRTVTILLAPGYAPFEQYYSDGESQGPWTDIYGLGATCYRIVVGRSPMDAIARSKAILGGSKEAMPAASVAGDPRYSKRFLKAIDHALEFAERDRPQTIAEWRNELTGEPADVRPPPASAATTLRADAMPPASEAPTLRLGAIPPASEAPTLRLGAMPPASEAPTLRLDTMSPASEAPTLRLDTPPANPGPTANVAVSRESSKRSGWPVLRGPVIWATAGAVALGVALAVMPWFASYLRETKPEPVQPTPEPATVPPPAAVSDPLRKRLDTLEQELTEDRRRLAEALQRTDAERKRLESERLREEKRAAAEEASRRRAKPAPAPAPTAKPPAEAVRPTVPDSAPAASVPPPIAPPPVAAAKPPEAPKPSPQVEQLARAESALARGDHAGALEMLRPLAQAGNTRAQITLAEMYTSGRGVTRNNIQAYIWYSLAARCGSVTAAADRKKVAALLQPAEVQQADKVVASMRVC